MKNIDYGSNYIMTNKDIEEIEKAYKDIFLKKHYNGCHLIYPKCAVFFLLEEVKKLKLENDELKKRLNSKIYVCTNCSFNFTYDGDFETFQCPKCRCEDIK